MSQGKRIVRGFSRLGAWAAALAVIIGVGATGIWTTVQYFDTSMKGIDPAGVGAGLGLTVMVALAALVFFRGLGWIIAGFLEE